jgi:hypothetical protein
MRPIAGWIPSFTFAATGFSADGAFQSTANLQSNIGLGTGTYFFQNVSMDSSRNGAPFSGTETVPLHVNLTPAVFLGV